MSGLLYCTGTGALLMNASGALSLGDTGAFLALSGPYFTDIAAGSPNLGPGSISTSDMSFDRTCREYTVTAVVNFGSTPDRVVLTTPQGDTVIDTGCPIGSGGGGILVGAEQVQTFSGTLPECSTGLTCTIYHNCIPIGSNNSSINSLTLATS